MTSSFDPDALLAALPRRVIRPIGPEVSIRSATRRVAPSASALFDAGSSNGFTGRERGRTADLSNWLVKVGSTERPAVCDICSAAADDEHAEDYYDLTSWVGLCRRCHRSALHGRFARPGKWSALLDRCEVPAGHWSRLVSSEPFDLAALLRSLCRCEPIKADYAANAR